MPSESKNFASSPRPQPTSKTLNPTPRRSADNSRDMTLRGMPVCSSRSLDSALRRCQGDITHLPKGRPVHFFGRGKVKGRAKGAKNIAHPDPGNGGIRANFAAGSADGEVARFGCHG